MAAKKVRSIDVAGLLIFFQPSLARQKVQKRSPNLPLSSLSSSSVSCVSLNRFRFDLRPLIPQSVLSRGQKRRSRDFDSVTLLEFVIPREMTVCDEMCAALM